MISLPLLEELSNVLARPRLRRKYPIVSADVQEFLRLLIRRGIIVAPTGSIRQCRDPDDDLILETAVLGRAQYVVTREDDIKGDPDLIERLKIHRITVLSVRRFLEKLEADAL